MSKVNINFKMEPELKADFEKVCGELGITMSTAINMFAKQMVIQGCVPFEITTVCKKNKNVDIYDNTNDCLVEINANDQVDRQANIMNSYFASLQNLEENK